MESFARKSPLVVELSDKGYTLRVDADPKHCLKEAPHWHLYHDCLPIARITNYGVWTSFPIGIDSEIRREAEKLTQEYICEIAFACGQSTINEPSMVRCTTMASHA